MNHPFSIAKKPEQVFTSLYFGEIVPGGWIYQQVNKDLVEGFVGCLDRLAPGVMIHDDIFGKNRRTRLNGQAGSDVSPGALSWWNSESQGNWWDGFIRSAILVNNESALKRVKKHVHSQLKNQDPDGYMGIYAPEMRHDKDGENADLWALTTLLRGLLAYYEKTRVPELLVAIEKSVQRMMAAYPAYKSTPFKKAADGHSLIFTDILDRLHQLTGKDEYLHYALFLFENYNVFRDDDILVKNLVDKNYKFKKHGVHVYELFRSLITAYFASGNPVMKKAIQYYQVKLKKVITPSGAPLGDEWIGGRDADATTTGYEYCSIQELLDSYCMLMQKTGDLKIANRIEWLFYNAGQGARHPHEHGIAYLKTDNSYAMTGPLHPGDDDGAGHPQTRYKYSPVHQDVAVCCAPNAGRIYPYFIKSMWMRSKKGLVACLFGPSTLTTRVQGVNVVIRQDTRYPFSHQIQLIVEPENPVSFELSVRVPEWAESMYLNGQQVRTDKNGMFGIHKTWNKKNMVVIEFRTSTRMYSDHKGHGYISYGPLVFAHPIEGVRKIVKQYRVKGFYDLHYTSVAIPQLKIPENGNFRLSRSDFNPDFPWGSISLDCRLYDGTNGDEKDVTMVPMGATILRQVTFPIRK